MKEISIIIPTYRPKEYLYECLNSIFKQDIPCELYEILVILNGDVEPYFSNISSFLENRSVHNVSLIMADCTGVSYARNLGIELSKGKYLIFVDDDDMLSSNYLRLLLKSAAENAIVISNVKTFRDGLDVLGDNFLSKSFCVHRRDNHKIFANRKNLSVVWGKIIPKALVKDVRFNESLSIGEDAFFMAKLAYRIKYFYYTDDSVIYYVRVRSDSVSRRKRNKIKSIKGQLYLVILYIHLNLVSPFSYNWGFMCSRIIACFINIYKIILDIREDE